jgi:hypothetical protein
VNLLSAELASSMESQPPASIVRSAEALHYLENLHRIGGWLHQTTALAIIEALWLQERHGIAGNLAEIGVFQGKSFLALAAGARASETILAIDVFDDAGAASERPDYDVAAYGHGNQAKFMANLTEFFPRAKVVTIVRSSTDLRGREREFGLTGLRFLSIDGGHTRQLTVNDLRIADACLADGGVCCLDDVFNVHWTGVISGLFEFLQSGPGLVPVAMFPNKLFLTRSALSGFYASQFRALFAHALERERLELHQAEIDVFGDRWPEIGGTLRAIASRTAEAQAAEAAARATQAEMRALKAEGQIAEATARAERAERKLAKRRARASWVPGPLRASGRLLARIIHGAAGWRERRAGSAAETRTAAAPGMPRLGE